MERQDGKRKLRRLREQRGWSWTDEARAIRDMARRLGIDRLGQTSIASIKRTIARWESETPAATVPDERYQWVLAHLFAERDGRLNVGPGSDLLRLLSAFQAMGTPLTRITELQDDIISWVERAGDTPIVQFNHMSFDAGSVAEITMSFAGLNGRVGKVPFVRSQLALAPFLVVLGRIDPGENVSSDIRMLAARAFATAGRLAFELHDDQHARKYYATALAHAGRLPDSWLVASTCTSLAMITMHRGDELAVAEQVANRAIQAALAGSSMAARARAFAVQAEVAARRALVRPSGAALDLAQSYAAQASIDDPGGKGFDAARLAGFVGLYHLLVDQGAEAVDILRQAAAGVTEASDAVQRSIILADLASGYAVKTPPEPEASVATLHKCVELVGRTRGRVAMGRIRKVRQSLRPWDGERFVADLDDYLYMMLFD